VLSQLPVSSRGTVKQAKMLRLARGAFPIC
jgi:hypothetical protein